MLTSCPPPTSTFLSHYSMRKKGGERREGEGERNKDRKKKKKNERVKEREQKHKSKQAREGEKERKEKEINVLPVSFLGLVKVMGPYMEKALHFLICSQILNEIGGQEGG